MKKAKSKKTQPTGKNPAIANQKLEPSLDEVRRRAHEIYLSRGGEPGNELDDWLKAERELRQG